MSGYSQTAEGNAFSRGLSLTRRAVAHFFKNDYQLWACFLIPFGILLIAYFFFGVYPISKESVLSLDLNGQYVYYYDYMYDVFAGKESLFYSWSRNLSGEFMGIIGYYLASPFNLFVWIFPREMITEGLLTMMVTKVGAIGFCMAFFLSRGKGCSKFTTMVFAPLYALCSYVMVQTMNPMWLDGVMVLPLVIMGVEALIDKGKFRMLAFSLIYAFVTCFYIGYMVGIFAAIYFVYYYAAAPAIRKQSLSQIFGRIGLFALTAITAVLCSCFILLPVIKSLSLGKFEFSEPDYSLDTNFTFLDCLDKLLPNSYDTVRMTGKPFLYCGTLTLIMLPIYFGSNRFSARERISSAIVLGVMFVCMYITPVDMLWHGGQLPNWLPQRYSFMISFLLVMLAARGFEKLKDVKHKTLGIIVFFIFAVYIVLENMDNFVSDLGSAGRDTLDGITVVLPAILVLAVIGGTVIMFKDKWNKRSCRNALIILCCIELFYNTIMAIVKQDTDIVYSTRPSYRNVIDPTREVVQEIKAEDDGFYRMEKTYFRTVNDPIALNMYGLSHSSSTLNAKPINMLGLLGFTSRSHYTRFSGYTELTADLFGVKYILSCPDNNTQLITSRDDITVRENDDAMPIAYLVDGSMRRYEMLEDDPFANQNVLLSRMLGADETGLYFKRIYAADKKIENVTEGTATGGHHSFKVINKGSNAQVEYTIKTVSDGELFMYLPSDYERTVNVWVNKVFLGTYFETDNYHIKSLGTFKAGEDVDLILTLTKDDLYFKDAQFAYLDASLLSRSISELHAMNAETTVERVSGTHLTINANAAEDCLLFTTIPAEEGWEITVDGVKTDYITVMEESLMAVPVAAGSHTIEMKFTTASYPLALYATAAGIVLLALMIVISWRVGKNRINRIKIAAQTGVQSDSDDDFDENEIYDDDDISIYGENSSEETEESTENDGNSEDKGDNGKNGNDEML